MKCTTISELASMEVINLCDGARLGYPCDFELTVPEGRINAIIVPGESGGLGFGKGKEYKIPWCKVECFGDDTILVRLPADELCACECGGKRRRKMFR